MRGDILAIVPELEDKFWICCLSECSIKEVSQDIRIRWFTENPTGLLLLSTGIFWPPVIYKTSSAKRSGDHAEGFSYRTVQSDTIPAGSIICKVNYQKERNSKDIRITKAEDNRLTKLAAIKRKQDADEEYEEQSSNDEEQEDDEDDDDDDDDVRKVTTNGQFKWLGDPIHSEDVSTLLLKSAWIQKNRIFNILNPNFKF